MELQYGKSRTRSNRRKRPTLSSGAAAAGGAHTSFQLARTLGNQNMLRLLQDGGRPGLAPAPVQSRTNSGTATAPGPYVSPTVRKVVSTGGQPLDPVFRREAEHRYGEDLSGVRVHTDPEAARSADILDAEAYTYGNHIAFAQGRYLPRSSAGRRILAHELAHVVQQRRGGSPLPGFGRGNSALEQSADHAASGFARGRGPVEVQGGSAVGVARLPRSLHQCLLASALRDDELRTEIAEIQQWLTNNPSPSPDRSMLLTALADLQAEAANRPSIATRGTVVHTGTVGAGASQGTVEARTNEEIQFGANKLNNILTLGYSGANAANARWLQFVWFEMEVVSPTVTGRVTGTIPTSSGVKPFTTNPATPSWTVDSNTTIPFYIEGGGAGIRDAATESMFDRPGGASAGPLFQAALSAVPGATSATFTAHFSTYLLISNVVNYVVPWTAATTATVSGTTATIANVVYAVGAAGAASSLPANLRTVLHTAYPLYRNIT